MSERVRYNQNRTRDQKRVMGGYIDGNTVKKENAYQLPERRERVYYNNERMTGVSRRTLRNRQKALYMSAPYVLLLAVCSVIMCMVCAQYLSLRDEITNKNADLNVLETRNQKLKAENDYLDFTINSYKDMEYIASEAQKLGMKQAGEGQIQFYDGSESEYMKQYKNIPSN